MPVKDLAFETLRVTVDDQVLTVTLDDTGNPAQPVYLAADGRTR